MLFKLIYKDKSPEVKRTVELEGTYTLEEAREKRAWLKETYNWPETKDELRKIS